MSNESKSGKKLKIALIIIGISLITSVYANANFYKRIYGYRGLESQIADLEDEKNSLSTERDNLKAQVRSLVSERDTLNNELSILTTQKDNLTTQVSELTTERDNAIDEVETYTQLNNALKIEINTLKGERDNLVTDLTSLTQQMDKASANITTLESEITQLQQDYDELVSDYNMINAPASSFDTIDDFEIELNTDRTIYSYTDSIYGNVSINYMNGTVFEGTFNIGINPEFGTSGGITLGPDFYIHGVGDFVAEPPLSFKYGPGVYSVYVVRIDNLDGYIVASGHELSNNIRVTVEAK